MLPYKKVFPPNEVPSSTRDVSWSQHYGSGTRICEQKNVYAPSDWSDTAVRICAEKYFAGQLDTPERESSVYQMVLRVTGAIKQALINHQYMDKDSANCWESDMSWLILTQRFSFNSPVWFNIGVPGRSQQSSACFIAPVEDSLDSIADLANTNTKIFSSGSGVGTDYSPLRSSYEGIGGSVNTSSGPVSFMRFHDAGAGTLKSGGKTRRAAKMVTLRDDHPDLLEFIDCKAIAERAAHALVDAGFPADFDDPYGAYGLVPFQSANHSVRLSDGFMNAAMDGKPWYFKPVTANCPELPAQNASDILDRIAKAAWECGDPGVQFSSTINRMHTCKQDGNINSSNPCSEYFFLDNTACNLGSLNLVKFDNDEAGWKMFREAVRCAVIGMDALICISEYPTPEIAKKSLEYRTIGLGFTNLGARIMLEGWAYSSKEARKYARYMTDSMTSAAYAMSADLAMHVGPFPAWERNQNSMQDVLFQHDRDSPRGTFPTHSNWGFRNAQVTVLAPTGTISFMMDCVTTGIEPVFALTYSKKLVGGGVLEMVNPLVATAIQKLPYFEGQQELASKIAEQKRIPEGTPSYVVDMLLTAAAWGNEERTISPEDHLWMMAACQPHLSGGISKTVNLPHSASVADVRNIYVQAWSMGIKSVAVYRDGCKASQPLTTSKKGAEPAPAPEPAPTHLQCKVRPSTLDARAHKVCIGGTDIYALLGEHEGRLFEVFLIAGRDGTTLQGLLSAVGILISQLLRRGVDHTEIATMLRGMDFAPQGFTDDQNIPTARSILDYLSKYLECWTPRAGHTSTPARVLEQRKPATQASHGMICTCGGIMIQTGSCHGCPSCGATAGGCG